MLECQPFTVVLLPSKNWSKLHTSAALVEWGICHLQSVGSFVEKKGQQSLVHSQAAVVFDEAHLAKPVHKEANSGARVSFFMNRFRKLGFLEYNGEIRVHNSLLNIFLQA
jgi:hypothetical protein